MSLKDEIYDLIKNSELIKDDNIEDKFNKLSYEIEQLIFYKKINGKGNKISIDTAYELFMNMDEESFKKLCVFETTGIIENIVYGDDDYYNLIKIFPILDKIYTQCNNDDFEDYIEYTFENKYWKKYDSYEKIKIVSKVINNLDMSVLSIILIIRKICDDYNYELLYYGKYLEYCRIEGKFTRVEHTCEKIKTRKINKTEFEKISELEIKDKYSFPVNTHKSEMNYIANCIVEHNMIDYYRKDMTLLCIANFCDIKHIPMLLYNVLCTDYSKYESIEYIFNDDVLIESTEYIEDLMSTNIVGHNILSVLCGIILNYNKYYKTIKKEINNLLKNSHNKIFSMISINDIIKYCYAIQNEKHDYYDSRHLCEFMRDHINKINGNNVFTNIIEIYYINHKLLYWSDVYHRIKYSEAKNEELIKNTINKIFSKKGFTLLQLVPIMLVEKEYLHDFLTNYKINFTKNTFMEYHNREKYNEELYSNYNYKYDYNNGKFNEKLLPILLNAKGIITNRFMKFYIKEFPVNIDTLRMVMKSYVETCMTDGKNKRNVNIPKMILLLIDHIN